MNYGIKDMMMVLAATFPRDFGDQPTLELRTIAYEAQFKGVEGPRLEKAVTDCLRLWKKTSAPLPAHIAEHLPPAPKDPEKQERHYFSGADWAHHVMRSDDGAEACRDGYARELYVWATKNPGKPVNRDVLEACLLGERNFNTMADEYLKWARANISNLADKNARRFMNLEPQVSQMTVNCIADMRIRNRQLAREYGREIVPPAPAAPPEKLTPYDLPI